MCYSVMLPTGNSLNWKIVNERGDEVFRGHQQQCEEWLDMADFSEATSGRPSGIATKMVANRLPMFELASALLRRFWTDCAGEVRVSGELPAILAVMLGIFCLSSQLVFPLAAQEIALIRGASAAVCGHSERGTGAGNHGEAWCARSGTLDITCDALEDSR